MSKSMYASELLHCTSFDFINIVLFLAETILATNPVASTEKGD